MAIGHPEDRDNPWNPAVLGHHLHVWDPIRARHLGQRPSVPHPKAGHMTATDQSHSRCRALRDGGRPHMGSGRAGKCARPGMTSFGILSQTLRSRQHSRVHRAACRGAAAARGHQRPRHGIVAVSARRAQISRLPTTGGDRVGDRQSPPLPPTAHSLGRRFSSHPR